MMFDSFLNHMKVGTTSSPKISVYPIGSYNLEGIKILLENCLRVGTEDNSNVSMATVTPEIWLGKILDKHWDKISYVSSSPAFSILRADGDRIIEKTYTCDKKTFDTDEEIDSFFELSKFKKLVVFSMTKTVNLISLKSYYTLRYADITEKFEERDNKIEEILK